jgi:ABC-type transporter Mla MlaB component
VIRITIDNSKGSRLVVEGHLSGSAVDELLKSCAACDAGTILDLSGLIFADRSGAVLLNELIADGFGIEGCSGFIAELLLSNAGAKVT